MRSDCDLTVEVGPNKKLGRNDQTVDSEQLSHCQEDDMTVGIEVVSSARQGFGAPDFVES